MGNNTKQAQRTFSTRTRRLCAFVLALALTVACGGSPLAEPRPNIILIVVDTLRADRLGAYGNDRGLTPFLDSLFERGIVFRNAYATSSWTYPSVSSILTSRYPQQHRVVHWESILSESETTFPEVLAEAGYDTFAFQANQLVSAGRGFAQGFDHYRVYPVKKEKVGGVVSHARIFHERASVLNRDAIEWVKRSRAESPRERKPFFLYMQYMEPHYPWRPTSESIAQTFAGMDDPDVASLNSNFFVARPFPPTEENWSRIRDLYDAAIRDLDNQLRQFFDELDAIGALENSYVFFISDHGEELGEHGGLAAHGLSLFNEEIHVPLIVIPPSFGEGVAVPETISLVDIAPTILAIAGLRAPSSFVGRSFEAVLRQDSASNHRSDERGAYSSLEPQELKEEIPAHQKIRHRASYVRRATKVVELEAGDLRMYRLDEDPGETDPLPLGWDESALEDAYRLAAEVAGTDAAAAKTISVSKAMRERLKALGYAR